MKKYDIIFLLLLFVACDNKLPEQAEQEPIEIEENDANRLTLNGSVITADLNATAYKVQLVREGFNADTQVFVTEQGNFFQFDNLSEGTYTLQVAKKGYISVNETFEIRKEHPSPSKTVLMKVDENAGFTGKVQLLGEDGEDILRIPFYRNTPSVFFYLFNGTATTTYWNITCSPEEYIGKSFIINNEIVHLYSTWVKEIKPSSFGTLRPNEIVLIEVIIDPLLYTIKEHSNCRIIINQDLELNLSY
jgi:hypothetical protein